MRFDPAVLANDPARRKVVLEVLAAAVAAVDPEASVRSAVRTERGYLLVGDERVALPDRAVIVLGIGKAAAGMARGIAAALGSHPVCGIIATPAPGPAPDGIEVLPGGHPMPSADSVAAGRRILEMARAATADDLVLALISGGGSACAEAPGAGIDLDDLIAVNDALLASGAAIGEINTLRKHLSDLKGGRLAEAVHPARLVTLVLSDVVGNRLETIASGPTVPDPTTFADAAGIVERRNLDLPRMVIERLERGRSGSIPDTPSSGEVFEGGLVKIVGDGAAAAEGARAAAEERGIAVRVVTTALAGEAGPVGASLAAAGRVLTGHGMLIYAGETTVTVGGSGTGGRNQEVALAAGMALAGNSDVVIASMGTDGIDGPTPYAGGIADGGMVGRGTRIGLDPGAALRDNDSSTYLEATRDLLITGPTGTNVGDVMVVYRSGQA